MTASKWQCAILLLAAVGCGANAQDLRREPPVRGDIQAGASKSATCAACHGTEGIAIVPAFPSLAGQSATYQYLELRAMKDGSRPSAVMAPLAEQLSDQDMKDLSVYYASLQAKRPPLAAATGNADLGQTLYARGDAARGIPPCQGCHGADGRGPEGAALPASTSRTPWHLYPALGGLQAPYLAAQLHAYKDGSRIGSAHDRIMQGVVQPLDDAAIDNLAAYLEQLAPPEPIAHSR